MIAPRTGLREVLEQHAAAVEDAAGHQRVDAVHRRVRSVRRRRLAGVAAAAVLAVVAAGLAVALPGRNAAQPADAPASMVGHRVPPTTTSYGATYRYTRGYTSSDGHLEVRLPDAPRGVLVRAASAAGPAEGRLVLRSRGHQPWVVPAGAFGAFEYFEGPSRTVSVDLRGTTDRDRIALAVYTWSRHAPGYTEDGITFPRTVEGQRLEGAFIGAPGQDHGSLHVGALRGSDRGRPITHRRLSVVAFCSGAPEDAMVELSVAAGPVRVGCHRLASADAGHSGSEFVTRFPARAFTATIRLVGSDGKPIPVPADGRIGVGIYDTARGGVFGLPAYRDAAGHRWRSTGGERFRHPADRWISITLDMNNLGEPVLVAWGATGDRTRGSVEASVPGHRTLVARAGGIGYAVVSNGDPHARIRLRGRDLPPGARLVVSTYELADGRS